ncbi:MAG: hypothetical protein Ct9H300mP1_28590 [Planctomycetaceae bacterium]|nr:MAG: hypothetical protein Ct9H300mP1_28590 [Planctomycetaceae bacterium]
MYAGTMKECLEGHFPANVPMVRYDARKAKFTYPKRNDWPTRTAFAGLQDAERSTRRTAAEKPKRVQVGVFDLKSHPDRLPGKRTVPIRIPGDELRDLVTLDPGHSPPPRNCPNGRPSACWISIRT